MKVEVLKYLKNQFSQVPKEIDRLIISAFLSLNEITVRNNTLIKSYLIKKNSTKKEIQKLEELKKIIKLHKIEFNFETLIEFFEYVISPSDKIVNGAVYTPEYIRTYIVENCLSLTTIELQSIRIADISCGCGGFLLTTTKHLKEKTKKSYSRIFSDNIFGIDITLYSINRSKLLLSLYAIVNGEDIKEFHFNLFTGNSLTFDWNRKSNLIKNNLGFDIIVGNPPYVCSRNMNSDTLALLKQFDVAKTGHPDLYIPFFQIGNELLNKSGILGYITVNTFLKSVNGRALRDYFSKNSIGLTVINFGGEQVFEDRNTYTCICFIQRDLNYIDYVRTNSSSVSNIDLRNLTRFRYKDLNDKDGWNLVNDINISNYINTVENVGVQFKDLYETKNGIATLKNEVYKFTPALRDRNYYYFPDGDYQYPIEKRICRDIVNANKIKTSEDLITIREKIIFPYNKDGYLYDESTMKNEFPSAYAYLLTKKTILATRDKGTKRYEAWYAYGRKQSMDINSNKLFFPHICERPNFIMCEERDLLFYNGIAIVSEDLRKLHIIKAVLESDLFFKYIKNTTKDYSSGYISMSRNYLKNFGVYQFNHEQANQLLNDSINREYFLETLYKVVEENNISRLNKKQSIFSLHTT